MTQRVNGIPWYRLTKREQREITKRQRKQKPAQEGCEIHAQPNDQKVEVENEE